MAGQRRKRPSPRLTNSSSASQSNITHRDRPIGPHWIPHHSRIASIVVKGTTARVYFPNRLLTIRQNLFISRHAADRDGQVTSHRPITGREMHSVSATLSAITAPSCNSRSRAVRISSCGTSSSFSARGPSSAVGRPQCPSSIASFNA